LGVAPTGGAPTGGASKDASTGNAPAGGDPTEGTRDVPIAERALTRATPVDRILADDEEMPVDLENPLIGVGRPRRSGRLLRATRKVQDNAEHGLYASLPATTHYAFASAINSVSTFHTPNSYKEAMKTPQADKWRKACIEEIQNLQENAVWKLPEAPPDARVLKGRWVFKIEHDVNGKPCRYKARWVIRGDKQREDTKDSEGLQYQGPA
jgi:hypothetical protein